LVHTLIVLGVGGIEIARDPNPTNFGDDRRCEECELAGKERTGKQDWDIWIEGTPPRLFGWTGSENPRHTVAAHLSSLLGSLSDWCTGKQIQDEFVD
jgi:hypothetical protein